MRAKAAWEVRGGLIPGSSDRMLTKRWDYSSDDFEADRIQLSKEVALGLDPVRPDAPPTIFQKCKKEAAAYWDSLNDPRRLNWAELTFIWY